MATQVLRVFSSIKNERDFYDDEPEEQQGEDEEVKLLKSLARCWTESQSLRQWASNVEADLVNCVKN